SAAGLSDLLLQQRLEFHAVAHFRQAAPVEHIRNRLTNVEHQMPDLACRLVAVVTWLVAGAAGTGERRQRSVEHAHDVADHDLLGWACEAVASLLALPALNEASVAQLDQY